MKSHNNRDEFDLTMANNNDRNRLKLMSSEDFSKTEENPFKAALEHTVSYNCVTEENMLDERSDLDSEHMLRRPNASMLIMQDNPGATSFMSNHSLDSSSQFK